MHSGKCIDGAMYRRVCDSVEERSSNFPLRAQHWVKAPPSLLMASLLGLLLSHPATLRVLQILPLAISSLSSPLPSYTPAFDLLSCSPLSLPTLLPLTCSAASSILSGHHK